MAVTVGALVASTVVAYMFGLGAGSPFDDRPELTLFPAAQVLPLGAALAQQRPAAESAFATSSPTHPDRDNPPCLVRAVPGALAAGLGAADP